MDNYEVNVLTRKGGWKKLPQEVIQNKDELKLKNSDNLNINVTEDNFDSKNHEDFDSNLFENFTEISSIIEKLKTVEKEKNNLIDEENKLKINEKIKIFLNKSALAGDKLAIVQIAKWNLELSPEQNFENAYKWYNIAVALGIKTAKIKRDEMIENIEKQRLFEIQKESIKIFNKINNLGG